MTTLNTKHNYDAESYRDQAARILRALGADGMTQSDLAGLTGWSHYKAAKVGQQIVAEGRAVPVLGGMYDEPRLYAPGFEP